MEKHSSSMANLYFLAVFAAAAAASPRGRGGTGTGASFVHHRGVAPPFGHGRCVHHRDHRPSPSRATARSTKDELDKSSVDPLDVLMNGDSSQLPPPPSSSSSWDAGDDWSSLSSGNAVPAAPSPSFADGSFDAMDDAARILNEQREMTSEWGDGAAEDGGSNENDLSHVEVTNDDFVENAVDAIVCRSDYDEPGDFNLYDTASSSVRGSNDAQDQEEEIAFMIRCGQSPQQLLVSQGKALPELTDEMKYDPKFLLEETEESGGSPTRLPLRPKSTAFLERAVETIFNTHSVQVGEANVLDRGGISKWMTKCISSPLGPYSEPKPFRSKKPVKSPIASSKPFVIGPYDQSVSAVLSRYSQSHGSGRLTLEEFQSLYLEVAWSGYVRDIIKKKTALDRERYQIPSAGEGALIRGRKNTEKMLKQATLSLVWRDLEAHEIFSPAEQERVATLLEMERLRATASTASAADARARQPLMDECELFDEYEERLSHRISHSEDNDDDALGEERGWDFLKRKEKGSHETVEMASDGATPKRIRDGKFVFIDEESCIGCTQCAQIAPSTFKMIEDTGRARAYSQSNSPDVENAVMACPVTCMHPMSYDELKEMETSRDDGDGRTDHRHFGGGIAHTPLHLARRGSDANHKSSWYHYLKWKCHGSASCPQRGCYDCPTYAPGENPFFKERHRRAEMTRAREFLESGEADKWRKVVEL